MCSTLRENVGQAIQGLIVNDGVVDQGRMMMNKIRHDAMAAPKSTSTTGGTGASSAMDDVQLQNLVGVLAHNLDKVEALLNDPHHFPATPANDEQRQLLQAKAQLEAVVAQQRAALNIIAGTVDQNQLLDLQSRTNPISPAAYNASGPQRISMPEALQLEQRLTQQYEQTGALALKPIIDKCNNNK